MSMKTESIKNLLEDLFSKKCNDIKISDLLLVQSLTIDSLDFDNNKITVVFDEIKQFRNLHYLEICNIDITDNVINALLSLPYLETIVFRSCKFYNSISIINSDLKIRKMTVDSCQNFKFIYFSNLVSLKSITIKDTSINSFNGLRKIHLRYFEIIGRSVISRFSVSYLNVENFMLSKDIYDKYNSILTNLSSNIMVYADDGFYIEKRVNKDTSLCLAL